MASKKKPAVGSGGPGKQQHDEEDLNRRREAAQRARAIWDAASPASDDHAYLARKGVRAHGLRVADDARLVLPLHNAYGGLTSLQYIAADGTKRFLKDGLTKGSYFAIGEPTDGKPIQIAEGYATGASVFEASEGATTVIAFSAGNLRPVAEALRNRYPNSDLILCADRGAGEEFARAAAKAVGGYLAVPSFVDERAKGDFNDLAQAEGKEAVGRQITEAVFAGALAADGTVSNEKGLRVTPFSKIEKKPIEWLWPRRIALGKLNVLAGDPGLGKSQLATMIAAIVSRGSEWPDGGAAPRGKVFIVSCEDDAADTISPRLEACGADISQLSLLNGPAHDGPFALTNVIPDLEKKIREMGDVKLLIVDPISAYLGEIDSHKNADVRVALGRLAGFAATTGVAVVMICHLNKAQNQSPMARVSGSLAFVAASRSAWLVCRDAENEARRLFLAMKNNLGSDRGGFAFRIEGVTVPSSSGPIATSRIAWDGETNISDGDALRALEAKEHPASGKLERARAWLCDALARGVRPAKSLELEAANAGISVATLRRAADELPIRKAKSGFQGAWEWTLKGQGDQEPPCHGHDHLCEGAQRERLSRSACHAPLQGLPPKMLNQTCSSFSATGELEHLPDDGLEVIR